MAKKASYFLNYTMYKTWAPIRNGVYLIKIRIYWEQFYYRYPINSLNQGSKVNIKVIFPTPSAVFVSGADIQNIKTVPYKSVLLSKGSKGVYTLNYISKILLCKNISIKNHLIWHNLITFRQLTWPDLLTNWSFSKLFRIVYHSLIHWKIVYKKKLSFTCCYFNFVLYIWY